jgi:RNA polymerase sigma factor (sigma-70 family)
MIASARNLGPHRVPKWHAAFLAMVPTIIRYAKISFRDLGPDAREDLVQECVCNCVVAFARLVERGKQSIAYPTVLAMYAVRQIKDGRRVGKSVASRDVYDEHGRIKHGHQLKHIGSPRDQRSGWREQLVDNSRTPVPEQAAFRIDFPDWLGTLSARDRRIVDDLAAGGRTGEVAQKFGVSAGRVSQLRGQLKESWEDFVGDADTEE